MKPVFNAQKHPYCVSNTKAHMSALNSWF